MHRSPWYPLAFIFATGAGLLATALGLAVVVAAIIVLTLESHWFSERLQDRLEQGWNREVQWSGGIDVDWSLAPRVTIKKPTLENAHWGESHPLASADSISARISLRELLNRKLVVERLALDTPRVHLRRSPENGANWQALISEDDEPALLQTRIDEIEIDDGKLSYVEPARNTEIAAAIDTVEGQKLDFHGQGSLNDRPFSFDLTGDPPREVVGEFIEGQREAGAYNLQGNLDWGGHHLALKGQSDSLTNLDSLEFQLNLSGPNASEISRLFGYQIRDVPYRVEGTVHRHDAIWRLEDLQGHLANSGFEADLTWTEAGKRPRLGLTLDIETLNVGHSLPMLLPSDAVAPIKAGHDEGQEEDSIRWNHLIKKQTAKLRLLDFDITIRAQQLTVGTREFRNVDFQANLASGLLAVDRFSAGLGEGTFSITGTVDGSQSLPRGTLDIQLRSMDISKALPAFEAGDPGYLQGKLATRMENDALLLEQSSLRYWDEEQNTDIDIRLSGRSTESGVQGVQLDASGSLRNHSFSLEFRGGPLLDLDDPRKPYPVSVSTTFEDTEIHANGTLTQPLLLKRIDLQLQARGPDPARLWYITPFTLPHLPPYEINADLARNGDEWHLRRIEGTVGNSDLSGEVRWRAPVGERPELWADLTSRLLDLDDFLPVVGAAPATGSGEVSSPSQQALARQQEAREQVLPTAGLMRRRLKSADAHLDFKALEMRARKVPFEEVVLNLDLEDGVLHVHPLALRFAEGTVTLDGEINVNAEPAHSNASLEVSRVNLNAFTEHFNIADNTMGILGGAGKVVLEGDSVKQALASADGSLELLMHDGQIDALLVEAVGLDLGEVLFSLGQEKPEPVEILCLYGKLKATNGQANVEALTMATSDSNVVGEGKISFTNESYELVLEARPKDFSVFSSSSPVRLHGDFDNYNLDLVSEELLARGALAVLGAVAFPPAALLPLVETGATSGQAGCQQLIASSETKATE